MLLRYVVLFLVSILVTPDAVLMPGWDEKYQHGPVIGGIYWIAYSNLKISSYGEVAYIVFFRAEDTSYYHVARLHGNKAGLAIAPFFQHDPFVQGKHERKSNLKFYRLISYQIYNVEGTPKIMNLYNRQLASMQESSLKKLQAIMTMVDGWGSDQEQGALNGDVYWIKPQYLVIENTALVYIPCIVIGQVGSKYLVVMMSVYKDPGGHLVTSFFGHHEKFKDLNCIAGLYIHPRKKCEVEGNPKVLQRWNGIDLLKLPEEGTNRLIVASGMVDGWDAEHKFQFGGVYWILRSKFLGLVGKAGLYIPCIVIPTQVGNKYRVIVMAPVHRSDGYHVKEFFGDTDLQTGIPITAYSHLNDYYVYPRREYMVEANPKIMQRWETSNLLLMQQEGLNRLVMESEMVDGWTDNRGPLFGAIYWINPRYLPGITTDGKAGFYIPCVVLEHQGLGGNKYLVVKMFFPSPDHPGLDAQDMFLVKGNDISHLKNYHIYLSSHCYVEGNPKIMHKWGKGHVTQMAEGVARELMAMVKPERGGQHMTHQDYWRWH